MDVVGDCHTLQSHFQSGQFDYVICRSVLEHLSHPWVFADSLATVCSVGALVWVATHQTYPLHYYPNDYFRFSNAALDVLFHKKYWKTRYNEYSLPARVLPLSNEVHHVTWNFHAEAFLNVDAIYQRISEFY